MEYPYDRAIAFALLQIVALHHTYVFKYFHHEVVNKSSAGGGGSKKAALVAGPGSGSGKDAAEKVPGRSIELVQKTVQLEDNRLDPATREMVGGKAESYYTILL